MIPIPDPTRLESFCSTQDQKDLLRQSFALRNASLNRRDADRYIKALEAAQKILKGKQIFLSEDKAGRVLLDSDQKLSAKDQEKLKSLLEALIPWRKGPFKWLGVEVDGEWCSEKKWDLLEPYLGKLEGKRVLDIGCNNGYHLFRLAHRNPEYALGIDPFVPYYAQWLLLMTQLQNSSMDFQLLGIEDLGVFEEIFDVVLCMGVLYHHPDPVFQLRNILKNLKKGGTLIIEVQGINSPDPVALLPESRYAKGRGIWFTPSMSFMVNLLSRSGFKEIQVIDSHQTRLEEQHNTHWCPKPWQSLEKFLDPENPNLTVEGYPAPWRHLLVAKKAENPFAPV